VPTLNESRRDFWFGSVLPGKLTAHVKGFILSEVQVT
jgi:hypothetical protein